jgi:Zn-dependent protease with chaperone function
MTDDQFDARVAQLERLAKRRPGLYKFRVLLMALLGNAYLAGMLALIAALFAASLASIVYLKALGVKLALVVGAFLWVILRALWVKMDAPAGRQLARGEAPDLYAMIDTLRHALRSPRFHHVLITDDFNAAVVQVPRLGMFGWHRNYLLVGLPLMKALSVEQFKAVLAHEFGHLARGHGAFSNWIYRLRLRWLRLIGLLNALESRAGFMFRPFFNWYAPAFAAYSFPLARANEYEADATAARLTSPAVAAAALTNVNVIGTFLAERYWPQIHAQADDLQQPAFAPFAQLNQGLATDLDAAAARQWLERAMAQYTSSADTHPALADRLAALREGPANRPPAPGEGADRLLGPALSVITQEFDDGWKARIMPSWAERHRSVQQGRARLAQLDALAADGDLAIEPAYERARLTDAIGRDADAALQQLRVLAERAPDQAGVLFALATRLLARDDDAGRNLIDRAMALDQAAIAPGCEAMRDYCARIGRHDEARAWHQRLVERAALDQAAEKERNTLRVSDTFEPHGLAPQVLAALDAQLRAVQPQIRRAWLAKKRVRQMIDRPCYVLGFAVTSPLRLHNGKRAAQALAAIREAVQFPGEMLILNVEGDNYRFGRKLRRVKTARII